MYQAKKFDIPSLKGVSEKQIDEHLKLYEGYVKHTNTILEQIEKWGKEDAEKNGYLIRELWRRLAFEFDGMRSHEYYFEALEGGARQHSPDSALGKKLVERFGDFENFKNIFKHTTATRGSGWALLTYDKTIGRFFTNWVDEHHLGHLSSLPIILAVDCWEHAYMVDYLPGERGKYVDAYFENLNWETVEKLFEKV